MSLIDLAQLGDNGYDVRRSRADYLERENARLRTLLYPTARKYNQTYKELESLKESHGFYKNPLPFLYFPREFRDQIYFYSLRAPLTADTRNRNTSSIAIDNGQYTYKPPAPGLILANKKVHRETTEVPYCRNNFYFKQPQDLFEFGQRIGPANRNHIRQIQIWTMVPGYRVVFAPPEAVAPSDYQKYQSHWAKALQHSQLQNAREIIVETESIGASSSFQACMFRCLKQPENSSPRTRVLNIVHE